MIPHVHPHHMSIDFHQLVRPEILDSLRCYGNKHDDWSWTSPWRFRRVRICVRQLAWLLFPAKLARFQLEMSHACNLKTAKNLDMSKGSKGMESMYII